MANLENDIPRTEYLKSRVNAINVLLNVRATWYSDLDFGLFQEQFENLMTNRTEENGYKNRKMELKCYAFCHLGECLGLNARVVFVLHLIYKE